MTARPSRRSGRPARLLRFLPILLLAAPATAQPPAPPAHEPFRIPPLRFPGIGTVLDAIAFDAEATTVIDSFWQPAIAALVAANPQRVGAARAFRAAQRDRELVQYRPTIAYRLDQRAIELLDADSDRRFRALEDRMRAALPRGGASPDAAYQALRDDFARTLGAAAGGVNSDLARVARVALTPDGLALRDLNRKGLFACRLEPRRYAPPKDQAHCAALEKAPALKRLSATRPGGQLVRLSAQAYIALHGMVALGHAAGISLHRLLPPERVREEGFDVPPDRSFEQLVADSAASATPQ